jgi:hypothetical protein
VLQRSAQSIELPDHQDIAGSQILKELREHRPVAPRTAHHLGVDLAAAGLLQGIDLQGDRLILGTDPGVSDFHGVNGGRVISSLYSSCSNKSNFVSGNQFFELQCAGNRTMQRFAGSFEVTIVFSNRDFMSAMEVPVIDPPMEAVCPLQSFLE